jgi:hypothetical protein
MIRHLSEVAEKLEEHVRVRDPVQVIKLDPIFQEFKETTEYFDKIVGKLTPSKLVNILVKKTKDIVNKELIVEEPVSKMDLSRQ